LRDLGVLDDGTDQKAKRSRDKRDEDQDEERNVPQDDRRIQFATHEDERDQQNDQTADKGLDDADKHLGEGHHAGRNQDEQPTLNLMQIVEVHHHRHRRPVDVHDHYGHTNHACKHLRWERLRYHVQHRQNIAIDQNQYRWKHRDTEDELPDVASLDQQITLYHSPERGAGNLTLLLLVVLLFHYPSCHCYSFPPQSSTRIHRRVCGLFEADIEDRLVKPLSPTEDLIEVRLVLVDVERARPCLQLRL